MKDCITEKLLVFCTNLPSRMASRYAVRHVQTPWDACARQPGLRTVQKASPLTSFRKNVQWCTRPLKVKSIRTHSGSSRQIFLLHRLHLSNAPNLLRLWHRLYWSGPVRWTNSCGTRPQQCSIHFIPCCKVARSMLIRRKNLKIGWRWSSIIWKRAFLLWYYERCLHPMERCPE